MAGCPKDRSDNGVLKSPTASYANLLAKGGGTPK